MFINFIENVSISEVITRAPEILSYIWILFLLAIVLVPFAISYYVLLVPYGLLIRRRQFILFLRKTQKIISLCNDALKDSPNEIVEFLDIFQSLVISENKNKISQEDPERFKNRIVEILQDMWKYWHC